MYKSLLGLIALILSTSANSALVTDDWLVDVDVRYGTYWQSNSYEVLDLTTNGDTFHLELYVAIESSGFWQQYAIDWDGTQAVVDHIAFGLNRSYAVGEQNTPLILLNTSQELQLKAWGGADHYITLSAPSAVPIPSAVWLFSSGLIGLIGFAKRKAS